MKFMLLLPTAPHDPVAASRPTDNLSFAVIGHVRGDPVDAITNRYLPSVIDELQREQPNHVFLTGDLIWGDFYSNPSRPSVVNEEWDALDRALAPLTALIHRVPGNHDINDVITRDIYIDRYGRPPSVINDGRCRFILLCSALMPSDGSKAKGKNILGVPLGAAQMAYVQEQLSRPEEYDHAFLFMHHVLWWEENAPWWRDVHPLLIDRKVRAVFAGDLGPYKYSHTQRDGIDYFQAAIEGPSSLAVMRQFQQSALLGQLMDVYLMVHVAGQEVRYEVRPVAATQSGKYSPQRWRELHQYRPWYSHYLYKALDRYPQRVLTTFTAGGILLGLMSSMWYRRWRLRAESRLKT